MNVSEKLNKKIIKDFGINLKKYVDDEISSDIFDLITFPKTLLEFIIKSLIIGFIVYVIGFNLIKLDNVDYIFYTIFGLVGNIIITLNLSIYLFLRKIKGDLINIINYTFNFIQRIPDIKNKMNKDNYKVLIRGVFMVIILPNIKKTISDKIPILGFIFNKITSSIFVFLFNRKNDFITDIKEDNTTDDIDIDDNGLDILKDNNFTLILSKIISVFQKPLFFTLIISSIFYVLFIISIW